MYEPRKRVEAELEGGGTTWFYVCGECHGSVNYLEDECRHCKTLLSWEGLVFPTQKRIYTGEHTEPSE